MISQLLSRPPVRRAVPVFCALVLLGAVVLPLYAEPPAAQPAVTGSLSEIGGVRVLRVWGTPHECGYAQGYLLGKELLPLLDDVLTKGGIPGGPEAYETKFLPMIGLMRIEPRYQEELRGILAGVEARLGEAPIVPSVNRPLRYEDLVAINCIPDFARMGCSSFAAWGPLTVKGDTLAGRNLDWVSIQPLLNSQLIVARLASPDGKTPGWVSVTWPCIIGCLTGMNADGITVSMHDVRGHPPSGKFGFTPRALALREAIESARPATAAKDIAHVLRSRLCAVGNNVASVMPYARHGSPSVVFEYDGDREDREGVTVRLPNPKQGKTGDSAGADPPPAGGRSYYQVCTNHYRLRATPQLCERYAALDNGLKALTEEKKKLDVDGAWKLLQAAAQPRAAALVILTYQSVVFEPL